MNDSKQAIEERPDYDKHFIPTGWHDRAPGWRPRYATQEAAAQDATACRMVRAKNESLVYRGIHPEDYVLVRNDWPITPGAIVLALIPQAAGDGRDGWILGVYRQDAWGERLEADDPPPYEQRVLVKDGYEIVGVVVEVQHYEEHEGECCLYRYPRVASPWRELTPEERAEVQHAA